MTYYIPASSTFASAALTPLIIAGLVTPIVDADGGLGIDQVKDGVFCAINAYLQMEKGDFIEVFFTSQERADAYKIIREEDVDKRIHLTIPRAQLLTRTYENVHYRITRANQTVEKSPTQNILVLLTRPGGVDRDSDPVSHSELHQALEPDVVERGIDAERAKLGTWVTILPYPYMRVRDKIELKWGILPIHHTVTKEQAEDPANHPIKIFVSRTVIENAGSSIKLPVMFKPIDEANNLSDENGPWSTPSYVDVDLDDSKLFAPFVDVADFVTGEIDLKALNGKDVKVEVQTSREYYQPGDQVHLTWAGKALDGTVVTQPFEFDVDVPGKTYQSFVRYDNVKAIVQGQAVVSYEVQTDKGRLYSKKTFVRVVGQLNALLAPTIDKANGNYLPPNLSKATATIPYYPGRTANDLVILFITAVRPGGGTELYEDARLVGDLPPSLPITRDIQKADLDRFDGLNITVLYEIHTASVRPSDELKLTVGEPRKDLPAPILEGTTPEGVFDPVPDREVIYQIPLILTITKDKGTWYFQGLNQAASTQGTFELTPGSSARAIRIPLPRHYVDLNQGHTIRMFYNLTRDGKMIYSDFREVRIGTPLPTLLEPTVVEAPGRILDPNRYQDGFTVRVVTSTFKPDDAIELTVHGRPGDGSTTPERKMVNGQASVDFNVPAAITGANLKTVVNISYKVIRLGQETPSKTLELNIGALLQQSMPRPLIEGFVGELLEIGSIKDNTKVLSDKWPFQRSGLPIWLSYVESRTDGTTRSRDQFVGTSHDQGAGLSYTTEVQWLRECKADSKLEIVLKVGLFKEATVNEAVECQARVYTVKTGLDVLSTFAGFDWDQWTLPEAYKSQISLLAGEHFVESIRLYNGYHYVYMQKIFQDIKIGEQYLFSFDYRVAVNSTFYITQNGTHIQTVTIPGGSGWQSTNVSFYAGTTQTASPMTVNFYVGGSGNVVQIDNIRLREIARS